MKHFNTHLNGFHFYNGNINAQVAAHHYVHQLNEDVRQTALCISIRDHRKPGISTILWEIFSSCAAAKSSALRLNIETMPLALFFDALTQTNR